MANVIIHEDFTSSPRIVSLLKRKYEASEATISVVNPIRI